MYYNADKVMNGLVMFVDAEIINKLPTAGKWLLGSGIAIATSKANEIAKFISENTIAMSMGIVDESGNFDVDLILDNMKKSANKYGKMSIQIPVIGKMTFSESDIDLLKSYIER